MDNHGWMDISTCPVAKSRKDARTVLVWHVFNGTMVYSTLNARENRFNMYWQEPPETWIDPHERMPTREDADDLSCILVIDRYGDIRVRGWRQVETPEDVYRWAKRPEPPDNYRELRDEMYNRRTT